MLTTKPFRKQKYYEHRRLRQDFNRPPVAVAEFERGLIRERVNAGLKAAKSRGVRLGRPETINGRAADVLKLKARGLGLRAIARKLGMAPFSVHKALNMAA